MRRAVVVGLVVAGLFLSGCGKDKATDYNSDVEKNFIQTCTDQAGERDVCQCAYDAFVDQIPFDRFQRVDQRLADNPESNLPDDFVNIYTDCVVRFGGGSAGSTPTLPTTTTTAGATTTTLPGGGTVTTAPVTTDSTAAP